MLEGSRLRGTVAIFRDLASDQTITDFSPSVPDAADPSGLKAQPNPQTKATAHKLKTGSRILVDILAANHDPTVFPDPEMVRLDRPVDSYILFGEGPHACLGRDLATAGLTSGFKKIVGLKNLRRAPGARGQIKSMPIAPWNGQVGSTRNPDLGWTGLRQYMTTDQSSYWPIPSTMKVWWDEDY